MTKLKVMWCLQRFKCYKDYPNKGAPSAERTDILKEALVLEANSQSATELF